RPPPRGDRAHARRRGDHRRGAQGRGAADQGGGLSLMASRDATKIAVSDLSEKQAKAEHARLHAELTDHDKRYYQDDKPTVTDAEYDALKRRYGEIEERFPELKTLESLSLKVGAAPTGRFAKVRHAVPMLSLDNAFSEEDVTRFVDRIRRFLK